MAKRRPRYETSQDLERNAQFALDIETVTGLEVKARGSANSSFRWQLLLNGEEFGIADLRVRKSARYQWPNLPVSMIKWGRATKKEVAGTRVFFFVRYTDADVYVRWNRGLGCTTEWGRDDRGDSKDIEKCRAIPAGDWISTGEFSLAEHTDRVQGDLFA
jgi:hypothetical protein